MWKRWQARQIASGSAEQRAESRNRAALRIGALGSGSDYTPFLQQELNPRVQSTTEVERLNTDRVKTGVFLGRYAINPVNGSGEKLSDAWVDRPVSYLGLGVAGFPNLFFVNGPGATSLFGNVPLVAEHDVDWIGDCIAWLEERGKASIQPEPDAQYAWTTEVNAVGDATLLCKYPSWYTGANIPGKKRAVLAYMGGFNRYAARCREVAETGYAGFVTE